MNVVIPCRYYIYSGNQTNSDNLMQRRCRFVPVTVLTENNTRNATQEPSLGPFLLSVLWIAVFAIN